jgi:hypothetical protein
MTELWAQVSRHAPWNLVGTGSPVLVVPRQVYMGWHVARVDLVEVNSWFRSGARLHRLKILGGKVYYVDVTYVLASVFLCLFG